jgi:Na+/H+-dicarboxylate symporter
MTAVAAPAPTPRFGLSARIVIGLALGIALGVVVGEPIAVLQPLADIYVRLLQMTVLPYLAVTLVVALGSLAPATAWRLARIGGVLLLATWALALAVIGLLPAALPPFESAVFFSHALIESPQPLALIETYVPANPFNALANAVVPAVVLFCCAIGVALIGIPRKRALLTGLRTLEIAIVRVTQFVLRTTPVGVLAIAAVAAGTLDLATLQRLQGYFIVFAVAALLLAFVLLPLLVMAVTPLRYREVAGCAGDALLTAFVANNAFIVLPVLIERTRELLRRRGLDSPDSAAMIEVLLPLSFVFPNAGKLLTLLFVPFVAWMSGAPLGAADTATLFGAGVFAYFAKAQVALPFLMDLTQLPHDYFQLYIPTTLLTGKFDSMVTAAALVAAGLLGGAAAGGQLRFAPGRLARSAALALALTLAAFIGLRALLAVTLDTEFRKGEALVSMHAPRGPLPVVALAEPPPPDTAPGNAFDRVRARGTLRVAFVQDRPPFTYRNRAGELVGMDVELAGRLARDLGVYRIEFIAATDWAALAALLVENRADVAMGVPYTSALLPLLRYSAPYVDGVLGFAVPDAARHGFTSVEALRRGGPLVLGVRNESAAVRAVLRERFAGMDFGFTEVREPRQYFEGRRPEVDAMVLLAQEAAAWSLLYPAYSVVVPQPDPIAVPVGIVVRQGHDELARFIDDWLVIEKASGAIDRAHSYWVLGQGAEPPPRRWSVLRDVLGWRGGTAPAERTKN